MSDFFTTRGLRHTGFFPVDGLRTEPKARWIRRVPGDFSWSRPVVFGDRIYGRHFALDLATGEQVLEVRFAPKEFHRPHIEHVCVTEDLVFCAGSSFVGAYERSSGTPAWERWTLRKNGEPGFVTALSMTDSELVVLTDEGKVILLSLGSGEILHEVPLLKVSAKQLLGGGSLAIPQEGRHAGMIFAEGWRETSNKLSRGAFEATLPNTRVFKDPPLTTTSAQSALRTSVTIHGEVARYTDEGTLGDRPEEHAPYQYEIAANEDVTVVFAKKSLVAFAEGKLAWKADGIASTSETPSGPTIDRQTVYVPSWTSMQAQDMSGMHAFDAMTGTILWRLKLPAGRRLDASPIPVPAGLVLPLGTDLACME